MSEDCQKCGTAMWDLDEDRNCPSCSDQEIDLLATCGTFDTSDCISHEDLRHFFNKAGNWEQWMLSQIEQEGVDKYKAWYGRMNSRCDLHNDLIEAHNKLFKGEMN